MTLCTGPLALCPRRSPMYSIGSWLTILFGLQHNMGAGESELPSVLEEGEDDATVGTFSFYAPHASDSHIQHSRSSILGPKSRRAKKLFNSTPVNFSPAPAPHEPGELERRHKCRRGVFDFLENARHEEEKLQSLIEVTHP